MYDWTSALTGGSKLARKPLNRISTTVRAFRDAYKKVDRLPAASSRIVPHSNFLRLEVARSSRRFKASSDLISAHSVPDCCRTRARRPELTRTSLQVVHQLRGFFGEISRSGLRGSQSRDPEMLSCSPTRPLTAAECTRTWTTSAQASMLILAERNQY